MPDAEESMNTLLRGAGTDATTSEALRGRLFGREPDPQEPHTIPADAIGVPAPVREANDVRARVARRP